MFCLTLITQLFDPSCHCGKANIHSFGGICHRVVLVNNQLSGFAFKLCAEISFSLEHLCCSEVSIQVAKFSKTTTHPFQAQQKLRFVVWS